MFSPYPYGPNGPREKDVVALCDQLARAMGWTVVNLSQQRRSTLTLGLPDRRYRCVRYHAAFWFEAKAPGGKLSREQYAFLEAEYACGEHIGAGGLDELKALLSAFQQHPAQYDGRLGWQQVERLAARGFRGERKAA